VDFLQDFLVGDVNGDGKPDALVGYFDGATGRFTYSVYLNNGDGSFRPGDPVDNLFHAQIADVNRDGRADLVGCGRSGPRVLLGGGDGRTWADAALPAFPNCEAIAVGDFDGDGMTDFAFGMRGAGGGLTRFAILRGRGDGTFQAMGPIQGIDGLRDDRPGYFRFLAGNFNADSRTDLAILFETGPEGYRPEIRFSNGDGTFSRSWPQDGYPGEFAQRTVNREFTADLNGDGRGDLLLSAVGYTLPLPPGTVPPGSPTSGPLPGPLTFFMPGRGDGTLATPSWSMATEILALGDIDRDGRPDLVYWQSFSSPSVVGMAHSWIRSLSQRQRLPFRDSPLSWI
jgi:hypothetical protein